MNELFECANVTYGLTFAHTFMTIKFASIMPDCVRMRKYLPIRAQHLDKQGVHEWEVP